MSTDTGYLVTLDGHAMGDGEGLPLIAARFDTPADAAAAAADTTHTAAEWLGMPEVAAEIVPAADYIDPGPAPAPAPLTPAQVAALDTRYAPPLARITYTYAIRMANGTLYRTESDMTGLRSHSVWLDIDEARAEIRDLTERAASLNLVGARFDLVAYATVTTVTGWQVIE